MSNRFPRFCAAVAAALLIAAGVARGLSVNPLLAQGSDCAIRLDRAGAIAPMAGATVVVTATPDPANCNFEVSALNGVGTIVRAADNTAVVTIPENAAAAREALFQIGDQVFRVVQAGPAALTRWQIGDVFIGAGSYADSPGVYKTLAPQGTLKLASGLATPASVVPDLLDGAGYFSSGCMVDPTPPGGNGHLFTASWTANTLSIFDGVTHQLRDVFPFTDPGTIHPEWGVGVNTPLAAIPHTTLHPLPAQAIGTPDDPSTPGDDFIPPDIQGFEQVVFADNGEFYVGTQTPIFSDALGLGHGYLLRFRYVPDAVAPAARLTLTGWWKLDAGAIADRSADRLALGDTIYADGTSDGASGVDQFDLSSDQETIFYTSEDNFIRRFNVVTGAAGTIRLKDEDGLPLDVHAYGIRILPGPLDAAGNATAADGSAGFLVATSNNEHASFVLRVDATGRALARYEVPGQPFALNLTPDAQYFWTAITQSQPDAPSPTGGILYRFHIASGARERFEPGTTGVYGLCVKREYSAATADGRCFNLNPDGSYGPETSACRTPPVCLARGLDNQGNENPECFPPGFSRPVYAPLVNREGDSFPDPEGIRLALDFNRPGFVVMLRGLTQIPGLTETDGVVTGTIGADACTPGAGDDPNAPKACVFTVNVHWMLASDYEAHSYDWQRSPFTWTILHGNAAPVLRNPGTITLEAGQILPTPDPAVSCIGSFIAMQGCAATPIVIDPDQATDSVYVFSTGLPPGLALTNHTSYGNGWRVALTGTAPTTSGDELAEFNVTITVCDGAGLLRDAAGVRVTPLACDPTSTHTRTETFLIRVDARVKPANSVPVCSGATATPGLLWTPNHQLVPLSIQNVTDADGDSLAIVITSITQNQPVDDTGDGATGFDATGVGTSSGAVRAERTGNLRVPGDGRLYEVHFTASDGKTGGTCGGTVFVGVPHDQGQRTLPADNGCRWNSVTGQQLGPCAWLNPPVLTPSNRTSAEGAAINLQITAVDPDGTPLTYSAASLPPGLSMSPSGLITGTIASGAAAGKSKKYTIAVNVNDGYGTVRATFTWTVTRP
jgi:hypothetical protein